MSTTQTTFDDSCVDPHEGEEQCPDCKQWFKQLGQHWRYNEDHRPSLTDHQRELIIGSLLGDGYYKPLNFCFEWKRNTTFPYLKWIKDQFGSLVSDIRYEDTPEESRIRTKQAFGKGYDCMANFTLRTRPHPELQFCEDWGSGENTHFPDNITLTPTILKIWYVSDGSLYYDGNRFNYVRISNVNQSHRVSYLKSLFDEVGIGVGVSSNKIRIPKSQTEQFFEYIGDTPTNDPAGFAYKWAYHDCEEYDRLKNIHDSQPYLDNWSKDD